MPERFSQAFLNQHLLAAEKPKVGIGSSLRGEIPELCADPIEDARGIRDGVPGRNGNTVSAEVCFRYWVEPPGFLFVDRGSHVIAGKKQGGSLQGNWKECGAGLLADAAENSHLDRAMADESAVLAALPDIGLKVLEEVPGYRITVGADEERGSVCDRVEFSRSKEPKPLDRHLY